MLLGELEWVELREEAEEHLVLNFLLGRRPAEGASLGPLVALIFSDYSGYLRAR